MTQKSKPAAPEIEANAEAGAAGDWVSEEEDITNDSVPTNCHLDGLRTGLNLI